MLSIEITNKSVQKYASNKRTPSFVANSLEFRTQNILLHTFRHLYKLFEYVVISLESLTHFTLLKNGNDLLCEPRAPCDK